MFNNSERTIWHSVDDRLPKKDSRILMWNDSEGILIGWHDEDGWYAEDVGYLGSDGPTHWASMPLGPHGKGD